MLGCYTLSLLSLPLTLSIIVIIIIVIIIISSSIIIISIINTILEEKQKATEWNGGFANKTVWTCLYACYLCTNFFLFVCFLVVFCKQCKAVRKCYDILMSEVYELQLDASYYVIKPPKLFHKTC